MIVLDASALLAYLNAEPGSDVVEEALAGDVCCSAVNWAEVAQKIRAIGGDWSLAAALLASHGLVVEPFTTRDAERAAALWQRGSGLSLADRSCLALAARLGAVALTADAAWGSADNVRQIRRK